MSERHVRVTKDARDRAFLMAGFIEGVSLRQARPFDDWDRQMLRKASRLLWTLGLAYDDDGATTVEARDP